MKTYTDSELLYAATARCKCGAGVACPLNHKDAMKRMSWDCSAVLKGEETDEAHDSFPFAFYKVREETSINGDGRTTRPEGTRAFTVGRATCGACEHEWESEPYVACGRGHHWFPGACPECGNDCGANGSWSSTDERPRVETRYRDVVLTEAPKDESNG